MVHERLHLSLERSMTERNRGEGKADRERQTDRETEGYQTSRNQNQISIHSLARASVHESPSDMDVREHR
jgi:hypothetical protein